MKKAILAFALLLLAVTPAWAANQSCDASLVSCGVCRASTGQYLLWYDAPNAEFARLRDAIVAQESYQSEVVCRADRQFDLLENDANSRVVSAAGVTEGDCTAGELGTNVANPQTQADFSDAIIHRDLRNRVIRYENAQNVEAADDPSSIAEPDLGQ